MYMFQGTRKQIHLEMYSAQFVMVTYQKGYLMFCVGLDNGKTRWQRLEPKNVKTMERL